MQGHLENEVNKRKGKFTIKFVDLDSMLNTAHKKITTQGLKEKKPLKIMGDIYDNFYLKGTCSSVLFFNMLKITLK